MLATLWGFGADTVRRVTDAHDLNLARAAGAFDVGQFARALEYARAALADDPESLRAHAVVALAASASGDLETAERAAAHCLANGLVTSQLLIVSARGAAARGAYDVALDLAERAVGCDPDDPTPRIAVATLLDDSGATNRGVRRHRQARRRMAEEAAAALDLAPDDPDVIAAVVQIQQRLGAYGHARDLVRTGLEIDPQHEALRLLKAGTSVKWADLLRGVGEVLEESPSHRGAGGLFEQVAWAVVGGLAEYVRTAALAGVFAVLLISGHVPVPELVVVVAVAGSVPSMRSAVNAVRVGSRLPRGHLRGVLVASGCRWAWFGLGLALALVAAAVALVIALPPGLPDPQAPGVIPTVTALLAMCCAGVCASVLRLAAVRSSERLGAYGPNGAAAAGVRGLVRRSLLIAVVFCLATAFVLSIAEASPVETVLGWLAALMFLGPQVAQVRYAVGVIGSRAFKLFGDVA